MFITIVLNFNFEFKVLIDRKKQRCMILLFLFFEPFPLPVRFSLLSKYLLWEKYCHYPLITTQGDRFTSCENIGPRPRLFSKSPPPNAAPLLINFLASAQLHYSSRSGAAHPINKMTQLCIYRNFIISNHWRR